MQVTIEDVQAEKGGTACFQAVIEGHPQPTVTWYKVGTGQGGVERTAQTPNQGFQPLLKGCLCHVPPGWCPAGTGPPDDSTAAGDHLFPRAEGCSLA